MGKKGRVNVSLDEEEYLTLCQVADIEHRSVRSLARHAVLIYLAQAVEYKGYDDES